MSFDRQTTSDSSFSAPALVYPMTRPTLGVGLILNVKGSKGGGARARRKGSALDTRMLEACLGELGLAPEQMRAGADASFSGGNPTARELALAVKDCGQRDHTHADCCVVVLMGPGPASGGGGPLGVLGSDGKLFEAKQTSRARPTPPRRRRRWCVRHRARSGAMKACDVKRGCARPRRREREEDGMTRGWPWLVVVVAGDIVVCQVSTVLDELSDAKCPSLVGKPRLVFVLADEPPPPPAADDDTAPPRSAEAPVAPEAVPPDFFVGHAAPGYDARRSAKFFDGRAKAISVESAPGVRRAMLTVAGGEEIDPADF